MKESSSNNGASLRAEVNPPEICLNVIDGKSIQSDKLIPVIDPSTGDKITSIAEADQDTVGQAVLSAKKTFQMGTWRNTRIEERQSILRSVADLIDREAKFLAGLECLNTGIPMAHLLQGQIPRAALNFRFFADYIGQTEGDLYTQNSDFLTFVRRDPVGVAALIGPWNAPLALLTMKAAAAIAFGNSCVVKPSEQTPLTMFAMMNLLKEAGVPDGVVNLVNGSGSVTGSALCSHPDIDRISFTGGTETGRAIMSAAANNLTPVTMELGGKSANIIFKSADLDRALDGALLGIFSNNGQQCLAGSRILLEESIAKDFIEKFKKRADQVRVGDPFDPRTEIGALGSIAHRDRVLSFVEKGINDGAELICGGKSIDDNNGAYMTPTAMQVSNNSAQICQEEIFGPFAVFQTFSSTTEAFEIANDTDFGLVSYVWSDDLSVITAAQAELRSGLVWVNTPMVRELRAPFGGFSDSGIGREGGKACESFYTEEKTVTVPTRKLELNKLGKE